jgi:hypothetical protein
MQIDLSNLDLATRRKVDEIFRRDFDLKILQALRRQTAVAARNYLRPPRALDGFGPKTFEVDAFFDSIWRHYYGNRYSADEDLVKFLTRRNPEIRVRSAPSRIQVGYLPSAESKRPIGIDNS